MRPQTVIQRWCAWIVEAGWLLALTLVPVYFNMLSARHFEPDKATALRAIVLVMAAATLIAGLEHLVSRQPSPDAAGGGVWQRFAAIPLAVPAALYVLVYLVTTLTSIVPATSFWGSYQRLQGAYTHLSYVVLFACVVAFLRRRAQLERLVVTVVLSGVVVAVYAIIQHTGLDPLPWRGDVIARVASTMGNSIFAAAFLLMVVPFALYRLVTSIAAARAAPAGDSAGAALGWAAAFSLLLAGAVLLWLAAISYVMAINVIDLRNFWVVPAAVVLMATLFALCSLELPQRRFTLVTFLPGMLAVLYVGALGAQYLLTRADPHSGLVEAGAGSRAALWWLWLLLGLAAVLLFYGLALLLPRRSAPGRLAYWLEALGAGVAVLAMLVAIVFTQSRGPWLGLGAALFLFVTLLLWRARLRRLLGGWIGLTVVTSALLVAFNLSQAPVVEQLRQVPYIGRMGQLLETDSGTGLVRRLIWAGDQHARGAIGLITSDPLRAVIGYGPESMFVAFNPFYPPTLATIESRGASPDRSHQVILDELVTRGVLGLISYLFVLISFVVLAWRQLRVSRAWHWQVFFIACLAVVGGHFVEGLTGIPIVATLLLLWVTSGLAVAGAVVSGQVVPGERWRAVGSDSEPEPVVVVGPPAPAVATAASGPARGSGRSSRGRLAGGRGAAVQRRAAVQPVAARGAAGWLLYAMIGLAAGTGVWALNLGSTYADMRFQLGQRFAEVPNATPSQQVYGLYQYLATVRMAPQQDYYYLSVGRTLMSLADIFSRRPDAALGTPLTNASITTLLNQDTATDLAEWVVERSPLELLSYAEATLERARQLNPRNKDHYANLARLDSFWYTISGDQTRLQDALGWYEQAMAIAPQDVALMNEYAGTLLMQGQATTAAQVLARSQELDPLYADTDLRYGDLYVSQGQLEQAAASYAAVARRNPRALDTALSRMLRNLAGRADLILQVRDAYRDGAAQERFAEDAVAQNVIGLLSIRGGDGQGALAAYAQAAQLDADNIEYRRNYSVVLSDTRQFAQALTEAQAALALAQRANLPAEEIRLYQGLVSYLQGQVPP